MQDPVSALLDADGEESDGEESVYSVTNDTLELSDAVRRKIPVGFWQVRRATVTQLYCTVKP
eukprot:6036310-Pyramimonas_sp.AAC.1